MIPSWNTRFAKAKFRLKTTQLKTIFNGCWVRKLFRGNCPRGNCLAGNFIGGNGLSDSYPGGIIQGQLSGEQKPGGNCPRGNFMGGNCLGVVVQGGLFGGKCLGGASPGRIVRGEFCGSIVRGQLSRVNCHWTPKMVRQTLKILKQMVQDF